MTRVDSRISADRPRAACVSLTSKKYRSVRPLEVEESLITADDSFRAKIIPFHL